MSTMMMRPPSPSLKSGVTFLVISGMSQYAEITRDPGPLTTSPCAVAAIDNESLPPSIAIPIYKPDTDCQRISTPYIKIESECGHAASLTSSMMSRIAIAQSYIGAPSPSIFAAHIQFPEACDATQRVRTGFGGTPTGGFHSTERQDGAP
jgi:hypothetical protein